MDLTHRLDRLLDVRSTDPDDARRRKLLNILLAGMTPLTIFTLIATFVADAISPGIEPQALIIYIGGSAMLVGFTIIYIINRFGVGWLASTLFLLLISVVVAFGDVPREVAGGRSLLLFSVPIITASVLLRPQASFLMAAVCSVVISGIALQAGLVPSPYAMAVFFAIAVISWLSARSLERALLDLRVLNQELDQRVELRTQELAEALAENRAVLESIADGVIVFDHDAQAIVANPAMSNLLGQPSERIVGHHIDTLMGTELGIASRKQARDFLHDYAGQRGLKFEWDEKTISVTFAPVRDELGHTRGTVAVFRDFTREAEISRMKSAFVSMVSHELRTPLNAILGYADMLKEQVYGPLVDKQRNAVERIITNTGQLLGLVNNLLDQAQIETGKLQLNLAPFSPAEMIDNVHGVMNVLAQAKGLTLTSHIANNLPNTVVSDRQRLHQILVNLIGNAIKFTDRGAVQVHAHRIDAERWALQISDTGCGIASDVQATLFEPFQRVDSSATRRHVGAGLGLSIVKQLVTLLGGEITLESAVNRGSTFTVYLPLDPTAQEEHA